jgi:hypothetical protein
MSFFLSSASILRTACSLASWSLSKLSMLPSSEVPSAGPLLLVLRPTGSVYFSSCSCSTALRSSAGDFVFEVLSDAALAALPFEVLSDAALAALPFEVLSDAALAALPLLRVRRPPTPPSSALAGGASAVAFGAGSSAATGPVVLSPEAVVGGASSARPRFLRCVR